MLHFHGPMYRMYSYSTGLLPKYPNVDGPYPDLGKTKLKVDRGRSHSTTPTKDKHKLGNQDAVMGT